ncbi:MAG: substrate-binding domain-containing protein [Bacteroidota bacterium]
MDSINVIGVPEHFNLPWHLAIADGAFSNKGIEVNWRAVPEGTGRMCQMLQNNEADIAIILTEGIVKSIAEGNPCRIVQEYVASPLLWGIHVAHGSNFKSLSDLYGKKAAISRYGSGSHLMAFVNAHHQQWNPKGLQFEVVHTLEGGIRALTEGIADYFMWERFTTKPWVDAGIFRRLDDCPTPWPCFVIACTLKYIETKPQVLHNVLHTINSYTSTFKQRPNISHELADRYQQKLEDVTTWLTLTQWSQKQMELSTAEKVQHTLRQLELIGKHLPVDELLYQNI